MPHPWLASRTAAFDSSGIRKVFDLAAKMTLVNPGDEVIVFDPYFVMYDPLVKLMAGKVVLVDTYPNFAIDLGRVRAAITGRTKAILFNSPANPTGKLNSAAEVRGLAK